MRQQVAILVFPDVEVLDFAGPFEVFAVADERHGHSLFEEQNWAGEWIQVH